LKKIYFFPSYHDHFFLNVHFAVVGFFLSSDLNKTNLINQIYDPSRGFFFPFQNAIVALEYHFLHNKKKRSGPNLVKFNQERCQRRDTTVDPPMFAFTNET
jgi:hypothetical protein